MNRKIEYAAGDRSAPFPAEWGVPPGQPDSEERARWVKEQVERRSRDPKILLRRLDAIADPEYTRDPAVALRRLAASDNRLLWMLRLAELRRRAGAEAWVNSS